MPENFASRYFRGQGAIFIGDSDANGNPINLKFAGDIGSAGMTPNVETVETKENVSGKRATAVSLQTGVEFNLSIAFRSLTPAQAALWMQAGNTAKAGATVTNEVVTAKHDAFTLLEHNKVSAVTVTDVAGTTTYTAGTDYVLDADKGMFEVLSTGTITDGQTLHVDYTYAAQHHLTANPTNADKCIVFAGINTADNDKQTRVTAYKVKLDPGAMDMIQTDQSGEVTISGRVLIDTRRPVGDQFFSWKTED